MNENISDKIQAELKQIGKDVAAQKKVIKRGVGNQIVVEVAELAWKALSTRRQVLESNFQKFQNPQPA